jgi:hypothetical protein
MRKQPRNPVLAFRCRQQLYAFLTQAADDVGTTISEEAERRLRITFEFDALRQSSLTQILKRLDALEARGKENGNDTKIKT